MGNVKDERDVSGRAESLSALRALQLLKFVLASAILARGVHLLATVSVPGLVDLYILDSRVYDEMATALMREGFFSGDEAFGHAPLYPLLLAGLRSLFGTVPTLMIALQQCLAVGSLLLTARIAWLGFGPRACVVATALYGFYGAAAMLEMKLMPSTLGIFLGLACLAALFESVRQRSVQWLLGAGILLGLTCLVRPNTLLFAPLAAFWLLWNWRDETLPRSLGNPKSLAIVCLFTLAVTLTIAPVSLRNWVASGEFVLITAHGGMTFYQSNNEHAKGIYSKIPGAVGNPRVLANQLRTSAEKAAGGPLKLSQVDAHWRDQAVRFLLEEPLRATALVGHKLRFWLGNDEISTEYVLKTERAITPTLWLFPVPFAVILGFAVIGLRRDSQLDGARGLLLCFIAANVLGIALFYFSSRYRLPAVPVLCVFAGAGAISLWDSIGLRSRDAVVQWVAASCLCALSLFSFSDDYDRYAAHQWYNYGRVYDEREMTEQAARSYQRALKGLPDQWNIHLSAAEALGKLGQGREAIVHYERALTLRPQSRRVRVGLSAERNKAGLEALP